VPAPTVGAEPQGGCMPTPEENMQSMRTFAEEVFGNKNLKYAADWLADDFVEHQVFPGTTPLGLLPPP